MVEIRTATGYSFHVEEVSFRQILVDALDALYERHRVGGSRPLEILLAEESSMDSLNRMLIALPLKPSL
jgi:hypothetical protein